MEGLLKFLVSFVVWTVIAFSTLAEDYPVQLNGTADIIIQMKRPYDNKILEYQNQLAAFQKTQILLIQGVKYQQSFCEKKVMQVEEEWSPMELLDANSRQCVQQYRKRASAAESIKDDLDSCQPLTLSNTSYFIEPAVNTMNELEYYYNNDLVKNLNDCIVSFRGSESRYRRCISDVIGKANVITLENQKVFQKQILAAECLVENTVNHAIDCDFSVMYDVVLKIGEAVQEIQTCIAPTECPPCEFKSHCNETIEVEMYDEDFAASVVGNPFQHLNPNVGCVNVMFKEVHYQ